MKLDVNFTLSEIRNYLTRNGYTIETVKCINSVTGKPDALCEVAYQGMNGTIPPQIDDSKKYWHSDISPYFNPEVVFENIMTEKLKNLLLS